MSIKRNISFSLKGKSKDGVPQTESLQIRMRVVYNGVRVDFNSGHNIDADKWDKRRQQVKNGCTNKAHESSAEINEHLHMMCDKVEKIFADYEYQQKVPTAEQLKEAFNRPEEKEPKKKVKKASKKMNIWQLINQFQKDCGKMNNWTEATYEKFHAMENHLRDFKENLTLDYLNEDGLNDYVYFLQDTLKMRNSTIGKQLGYLKWFLRWATKKGFAVNTDYLTFKPKLKTTQKKVIFLTPDEIEKLRKCQIPATLSHLERVRDVFLFCCFTGLRYSDANNLRRSDVKEDTIEVTTIKTADSLTIELNDQSKAILEKYKDADFEDDKALPVISNQRMNDYIKELGQLAGIDEPIRETYYKGNERIDKVSPKYKLLGTHTGRRTFICTALSLGIPVNVVMKWTGHSDYKAMKPYVDVIDDIKAKSMKKFNSI